jgi:hypothetical protein
MYTVELLTPIGIIPLSFEQELKDKDGNVKKFIVPIVFKGRNEIEIYIKKNLKDRKIYGYHIKLFIDVKNGEEL